MVLSPFFGSQPTSSPAARVWVPFLKYILNTFTTSHPSVVHPVHGLIASPRFTAEMCHLLRLLPSAHPDLFLNQQVGEQCFNKSHINLFIAHNPPVISHLSNGLIISGSGPRPLSHRFLGPLHTLGFSFLTLPPLLPQANGPLLPQDICTSCSFSLKDSPPNT